MWQFFKKEPEAVQIRHVARNRLQNLILRPHSFILKLCQTSGVLFVWGFGFFCYLTLAAGCTGQCALVYRGRILCERLQGLGSGVNSARLQTLTVASASGLTVLLSPLPSSFLLSDHPLPSLKLSL